MHPKGAELSDTALAMIAERFKALSEPSRLKLVRALMDGERTVSELAAAVGASPANVSKHLGLLAAAGILARRRQGLLAYYSICDPTVFDLCKLVCGALQNRLESDLSDLTARRSDLAG